MFNLEKFQAEFKAGRFDEFHYYSTLVKESTRIKETVSIEHLSVSRAAQLDSIAFDRFVNITGEKNNFECSLLIDTETGYLYSPKWFNTNNRTFATIHDYETFVAQQVIAGFNDWELIDNKTFQNFLPEDRVKWFDSNHRNKIICNWHANQYENNEKNKPYIFNHDFCSFIKSKEYETISGHIFLLGDKNKWTNESHFKVIDQTIFDCLWQAIEKNSDNKEAILREIKSKYSLSQKTFEKDIHFPFIYSLRFADLELWGNKFSAFTFIQFLVDNDFDTSFLPKAPNLIPYILESLQKTTGIQLHEDTINFPSCFFKHESDISKHQNLLAYLDFLLWKIEYYGERHQTELSKSNQLYSQLANLKTDNAVLNNIQQYLLQKFDFSLQNLEEKLLQFKSESVAYLDKIDRVDSVWQYAENQPTIDFNLIGEAITRLYNNQITKVTQFSESVDFLQALFDKVNALFIANQQFITAQKEQFRLNCEKEYVEDSFAALFSEWQTEITVIENHYFPIIQACFIGTINQTATLQILGLLADYRQTVDRFFLRERIALIQEYHENPKSEFLQKIDMENKLFKSRCALRRGLKDLITHEATHLTKKLLNAESQALLTQQIDNLLMVSQEANLSKALQAEFDELQQRNFEIYLADVEQYGHELEKRDKDIQALLFKMKKDLQRQTKGE